MGNIFAESNLVPTTLEDYFVDLLNMSGEEYTEAVDNNTYDQFIQDNAGYGLMQWTSESFKEKLLTYATRKGQSIGDLETQLEFLCKQLSRDYYGNVWRVLKQAQSIREASDAVVLEYLHLADQENFLELRAFLGVQYYEQFVENIREEEEIKPIEDLGLEEISSITIQDNSNVFSSTLHQPTTKALMDVYSEPKYTLDNGPTQCMMTNSTCYLENKHLGNPVGVVIHSTGINSPYLKRFVQPSQNDENYDKLIELLGYNSYGNDWNHTTHTGGAHIWIGKTASDKVEAIQTLPWDVQGLECGFGSKGSGNNCYIQIEICESILNNKMYFSMIYQELIHVLAYLCAKFHFNPMEMTSYEKMVIPTILCHQDAYKYGLASNNVDIYHWFNKHDINMNNIREDTEKLLRKMIPADNQISLVAQHTISMYDNLKIGDTFKLISGATYIDNRVIPGWIFKSILYIRDIKTNTVAFSTAKNGNVLGEVRKEFILPIAEVINYKVRVNTALLNVREQPDTKSNVSMIIAENEIYTIVDEQNGWGKLDNDAGWILLKYTEKI